MFISGSWGIAHGPIPAVGHPPKLILRLFQVQSLIKQVQEEMRKNHAELLAKFENLSECRAGAGSGQAWAPAPPILESKFMLSSMPWSGPEHSATRPGPLRGPGVARTTPPPVRGRPGPLRGPGVARTTPPPVRGKPITWRQIALFPYPLDSLTLSAPRPAPPRPAPPRPGSPRRGCQARAKLRPRGSSSRTLPST